MICYQIKVSGRVQGVWFRKSTQQKALELGLKGWVQNEADGAVLIEAAGEEAAMLEFVQWCRKGPPMAHVDQLSAHPASPNTLPHDFEIRR